MKMPDDIEQYQQHLHTTDKIAKAALKRMGEETGRTYAEAVAAFRGQDEGATLAFWMIIFAEYGDKYKGVDYCPTCQKFSLLIDG